MKPLLLGEAPSRTGDRYYRFPLSGAVARTLCQRAGLPPDGPPEEIASWSWGLYEHFDTLNAIQRYADASPWSAVKARERWRKWLDEQEDEAPRVVIALGRKAADAIGIGGAPWGVWIPAARTDMILAPHPSGRNRLLNDDLYQRMLGRILREALERSARLIEEV